MISRSSSPTYIFCCSQRKNIAVDTIATPNALLLAREYKGVPQWDPIDHTAWFYIYRDQTREWVFYTDARLRIGTSWRMNAGFKAFVPGCWVMKTQTFGACFPTEDCTRRVRGDLASRYAAAILVVARTNRNLGVEN